MIELVPNHDYFIGIDSDGCVFDTMEVKHKECFIPNFVNVYDLQGVAKYAREAAEFVNLYSKSRGINRFPALVEQLDWLRRRPEVKARGVEVPTTKAVEAWLARETRLGNPALKTAVAESNDPELARALKWSLAVNESVEAIVRNVPPFPYVKQCLEKLFPIADLLVVSATPGEALTREWEEHDIARFVRAICGQEVGTKQEVLTLSAKYAPDKRLMIGDAPGDYKAAKANACLFYPINPGAEDASWQRLYTEGIDRLLKGTFAGDYQAALLAEFDGYLPAKPPWENET